MADDFPRTVAEISTEWLSEVLGKPVTGFEQTVLDGGVLSEVSRLHSIRYDGEPGDAPPSVVVKVAHQNQSQREAAVGGNAYTKELRFFEDLASEVSLRTPKLFASFSDGSEDSEYFILVMEDLSSHSEVFDQVEDPPDLAFSRKLALEVAEMHAEFWESPATRLPWIGNDAHRYVFPLDSSARQANEAWPAFRADWQQIYGRDVFDREEDAPLEELTALLCGPQCHPLLDKIYDLFSSRPHTVLHGDLRASNIFRTDPALGKSVDESTLTIIDWQVIHAGPPGYEFMEAWMHSLEPTVRRKEVDLLREYHTKLVALEPAAAAYTYEMLFEDYTLSHCFLWQVLITVFGGVLPGLDQPEAAYMKDLFEQVIARSKTAMVDLDCLAPIRRFSAEIEAGAGGAD